MSVKTTGDSTDYVGEAAPVAALGEATEGEATEATDAAAQPPQDDDTERKSKQAKAKATAAAAAAAAAEAKKKKKKSSAPSAALRYLRGSLAGELTKSATKPKLNSGIWPKSGDHAAYWCFTTSLAPVLYGAVFKVGPPGAHIIYIYIHKVFYTVLHMTLQLQQ
jgi:hypothetical protein